ncbi:geranylgeranylglycerol-phosphate geranylgeranyltransferase [Candidatus Neomarinimicrobiota bacterium]
MNSITGHIKILRPLNLIIGAITVLISASILQQLNEFSTVLLIIGIVVSYNAAANVINDYCDIAVDRINRPERPLITGSVSLKTAKWLSIILFTFGSLLATLLPLEAIVVAILIAMPLMVLYSYRLKGLPLVGNVSIAFILGLTFIFTGVSLGSWQPMLIPALLAFSLTLVRELVKDIADFDGDKSAELTTFPILVGIKRAAQLVIMLAILTIIGTLIPYIMGYFGIAYLILLILGVEIPLIVIVLSFVKKPSNITAKRAAALLKFSTIAGLLAVWAGSVY